MDVQRDSLVLPNRKNPNLTVKWVFLPGAELGLTSELLLWAKEQGVVDNEPLFFSRKRDSNGSRRALQRGQAWLIVKEASESVPMCGSWRCALRSMVQLAKRLRATHIASVMRVCARSSAARATGPWPSARPYRVASRWRT